MRSYCHSNVLLLCLGMEHLQEIFITLTKEDGKNIGVYLFNHLTIAGVAFENIYMKYFLPQETLIYVPRTTTDIYAFKQILFLEYVMSQSNEFIAHAQNGGAIEVQVANGKKF